MTKVADFTQAIVFETIVAAKAMAPTSVNPSHCSKAVYYKIEYSDSTIVPTALQAGSVTVLTKDPDNNLVFIY